MLVPAKCTSCGDTIQVDRDKEAAVCPSCGSAFIVEKAINNYGTIINAQKVEFHTDGITVDNLLSLALEEAQNKKYSEAAAYLTQVMERGGRHPIFRVARDYFTELKKGAGKTVSIAQLTAFSNLLAKAHDAWKENASEQPYRPQAAQFCQLITAWTAAAFSAYIKNSSKMLQTNWTEGIKQCFAGIMLLDSFISWGEQAQFFDDSNVPEKQRQNWVRELMAYLQVMSLAYTDKASLTKEQAQTIYDLAAKYYPLFQSQNGEALAPRLISPHQGGEGIHSHLSIHSDSLIVRAAHAAQKNTSLSDKQYFSDIIIAAYKKMSSAALEWDATTLCVMAVAISCSCLATCIFYAIIPVNIFAVSFFIYLIYLSHKNLKHARNTPILKKEFQKILQEWRNSPAHGTDTQNLQFDNFVNSLTEEAAQRAEQLEANLLDSKTGGKRQESPGNSCLLSLGWIFCFPAPISKMVLDNKKNSSLYKLTVLIIVWSLYLILLLPSPQGNHAADATASEPAPAGTTAETIPANVPHSANRQAEQTISGKICASAGIGDTLEDWIKEYGKPTLNHPSTATVFNYRGGTLNASFYDSRAYNILISDKIGEKNMLSLCPKDGKLISEKKTPMQEFYKVTRSYTSESIKKVIKNNNKGLYRVIINYDTKSGKFLNACIDCSGIVPISKEE
ncbi:MAG: zinc ribbon domain-containing protein [bacterium]|nr:zinc ribbon domain-containing protein [bacterium]